MMRRRFRPAPSGGCEVRLPSSERDLLRTLPTELGEALAALAQASEDAAIEMPESLRRLFPPAYSRDEEAQRRYRDVTQSDLLEHHSNALATLAKSADATLLTEDEALAWLAALNDLRLVLGTVLEVSEEEQLEPESTQHLLYYYLGGLEEELVSVVSGALPDPVPGADDAIPEDPWGEPLGGLRWDGTPQPSVWPPGGPSPAAPGE